MKRAALAFLLFAALPASAGADAAYDSLVGMAQAAKSDRGPDEGSLPDGGAEAGATGPRSARTPRGAPAGLIAASESLRDAVAQAPAPAPRPKIWARLYGTLMPSWRRAPAPRVDFEASASSAPARCLRPLPVLLPPPDSEAVRAGELRGMAELLSSPSASSGAP